VRSKTFLSLAGQDSGIELQPLALPLDGSRRPVFRVTSDAAKDLAAPFAGFGFWAWEPGSKVILYGLSTVLATLAT
jgi:hypothetical protein